MVDAGIGCGYRWAARGSDFGADVTVGQQGFNPEGFRQLAGIASGLEPVSQITAQETDSVGGVDGLHGS